MAIVTLLMICFGVQLHAGLGPGTAFDRGPGEHYLNFQLPGSPLVGLLTFHDNQGGFVRRNADDTYWLHAFSNDASMYLGLPLVDSWTSPDDMLVLFAGTGRFTWFDRVNLEAETGFYRLTGDQSNITADFNLTSTSAAQALLGIPEGTPFTFRGRVVQRDGADKLFDVVFEPVE